MKRLISLLLAAAILVPNGTAFAQTYSDVYGTRYVPAYDYLTSRGVIQGYNDGTGRPYYAINRAEALKVILSARSEYAKRAEWFRNGHMPGIPLFGDTSQSAWYAPYLETAFEAGLVTGYPDRTFRPESRVTTEEAIVMIMRAYGMNAQKTEGPDGWFQASVNEALSKNIVASTETVYLGDSLTRGQFLDMVFRMDSVITQRVASFNDGLRRESLVRRPVMITSTGGGGGGSGGTSFTLSIPALGIDNLYVSKPVDTVTSKGLLEPLKNGVGHLFSYPGGNGKIMVYGHSSGYGWDTSKYTKIFASITKLQPGDRVYVNYAGKEFVYEVTGHDIIDPNDIRPFQGTGEELVLYTCWPLNTAKQRWITRAVPVNSVVLR